MELIARTKKSNELVGIADLTGKHDNNVFKKIIENSVDPHNKSTNVKAKMTDWNLSVDYPPFHDLGKDICENYVYDYLLSVYGNYDDVTKQKLIVSDMWGIVYEGNSQDHAVTHSHHWWNVSFVYYVDVGNDTSPLVFDDYNLEVKPKNSMLVLFDARAKHHVLPYKGKDPRVVIAGNIEVLKLDLYKDIIYQEARKKV
jgi:hypothetical protein